MNNENIDCLIQNVVDKFSLQKINKKYQKLYFSSLQLLPIHLKIDSLKSYSLIIPQKNNIFQKIEQKMKLKQTLKNKLIFLLEDQKFQLLTGKKKVFQLLPQYLISTLEYAENIIQFCQQLSKGQELVYKSLMSKCCRFFINLHQNFKINNLLKNLIQPIGSFDPFLIKSKIKDERNIQIIDIFSQKPQLHNRFIKANQQILRVENSNLLKKQQAQNIYSPQNVLKKYSLSDTEAQKDQQKSNFSAKKLSFNIQSSSHKNFQLNNQNDKKKIFLNFRKANIRRNFAKSVDFQSPKFCESKRIIQQKEEIQARQAQRNAIKVKQGKKFKIQNLRSVMLEPLQRKTQRSSISLHSVDNSLTQRENLKNIEQFRLRSKKYKKIEKISDIGQFNQNQTFKNSQSSQQFELKQDAKFKSRILASRKFSSPVSKLKNEQLRPEIKSSFQPHSFDNNLSLKLTEKIKVKRNSNFSRRILLPQLRKNKQSQAQQVNFQSDQKLPQNSILRLIKVQNQLSYAKKNQDKEVEIKKQTTEQLQMNQIIPQQGLNVFQVSPPFSPQPSSQHQQNQLQNISPNQKDQKGVKTEQTRAEQKFENERKKILLKAPKLRECQIKAYLQSFNIPEIKDTLNEIYQHQHYINQFYLNQRLFCLVVFSPSLDSRKLQIKLIHQINETNQSQQVDYNTRHRLRKLIINKYINVLTKSTQNLQQIKFKGQYERYAWITQCEFNYDQQYFVHRLQKQLLTIKKCSRQFLSMDLSILQIQQSINQSFLYSDDISPFKNGKYDVDQKVFSDNNFINLDTDFNGQLQTIDQVNNILESQQLDTFQSNLNFQSLIQKSQQNTQNLINLKILTFNQFLNKKFIVSNGWIQTKTTLIFNQRNQIISQIILNQNYEIYFGKGFEHIGTMKNKILHHKTKLNSSKSQSQGKQQMTKIRMFSKQLYGLVKHENGTAFYGNWEMNFHFKHQYMGKIIYLIDKQTNQNQFSFGDSNFFVNIYSGDQFVIGWEVEDNDFLY